MNKRLDNIVVENARLIFKNYHRRTGRAVFLGIFCNGTELGELH